MRTHNFAREDFIGDIFKLDQQCQGPTGACIHKHNDKTHTIVGRDHSLLLIEKSSAGIHTITVSHRTAKSAIQWHFGVVYYHSTQIGALSRICNDTLIYLQ